MKDEILLIQSYFREAPPSPPPEHIKVYHKDCGPQVTTTTSDDILQQYTISGVP